FLAIAHSVVSRDAAPPADQDFVGFGVIRFDPQTVGAHPVGVKLPSQSEGEGQFWRGAPPVAHVETVHVLQTVHLDVLGTLSRNSGRAEQKSCEAVPAVLKRWSVFLESNSGSESIGVQSRYAIIESERAAWAFAQLRLPMVHEVVEKVKAKADLVSALH